MKENPNKFYENHYSREALIRLETINEEERSIEGVLSTETPVIVYDWYRGQPVNEVLLMDGVELPGKVPLLDAHSRFSTADIIGSTTDFRRGTDDAGNPVIFAKNVFSSTEDKIFTKAKEGHITDTSIGYTVSKNDTVEVKPGKTENINGRDWTNDGNMSMLVRTKWTLKENSLVPIGADKLAKLRSEFTPVEEEVKVDEEVKVARSLRMNRNIHNNLNSFK